VAKMNKIRDVAQLVERLSMHRQFKAWVTCLGQAWFPGL